KENLKTIESLKSNGFESSENAISESENQCENDCLKVEKECDKVENPKVIAPGMFKLSVSQSVSPISMSKTSCDSKNVDSKLKRKRRKRKSSKQNVKQVADLNIAVLFGRKGSSNTSNVDLSAVSHSNLNKNVKRYSRKDLLSCNNSHLRETSSAYVCNDAINVSCNSRMYDLLDDNNFFIFEDESVKISPVSKMPFRKKPRDSMHVRSKSNMIKSSPRTVHKKTQVNLQFQVQRVRTDNGTEFKNKTLAKFFDEVGSTQQFSDVRTPQQNGVVERRNQTLVEAARTMLTFANLPSFLWAEAITTICFTQNRSIIHKHFDKTPYELMNKRKPNIKFFRVFGCRCYLLNDYDDVGKLKAKGNIGVLETGLSNLNETRKSSNPSVSKVSEASKKDLEDLFQDFYDEYFDASKIMNSLTTNVETSINEEVFHEVSESFQGESSSFSLNDDVQQSPKKTAFLNGILKEEVYIGQPPSFVSKQYLDYVYALDKALYGLKQAPRAWLQVNKFSNGIVKNQSNYILDILKRFGMKNYDTVPTPMVEQAKLKLNLVGKPVDHTDYRSMIGSLMYVTSSRPEIMFATYMCARYQANPNKHHVSAVKRIFRYLKGTINLGLWYLKDFGFDLTAYSDADHAGCHLDRKTESKYVAVSSCCAQVLWMRTQLTDYGFFYDKVPIYCDSKSAIAISCNLIQVTQKKVKIAFENADSSSRVELIPSNIKYANKVVLNFHKEFSVFSSFSIKENDRLLQDQVFKNKE
nr:hypothetical protein [Tanacetum cinerariifolium]